MRISLHFPSATGWQSILSHSIYDVSFESKTPPAPIERFILEWFMNCQGTRQDSPNLRYRKLMWEIVEYGLPTTTLCIRDYKKWNPIWESHFQPTSCNKKITLQWFYENPHFFTTFLVCLKRDWLLWPNRKKHLPGDVLVLWPPKSPRLQCGLSQRTWDRKVVPFKKHTKLGGGNSNIFYFHPENWGNDSQFDYIIFFKGVGSTTN